MGANGVSHHIVEDDLAGAACVLRWLAYTPARVGEPAAALPTADPVARHIDYRPGEGALRQCWAGMAGGTRCNRLSWSCRGLQWALDASDWNVVAWD